jgi:3',5'-cyclic AMP phosphodiesterase CpdA
MSGDDSALTRRDTLKCLAFGGAGTLFVLSAGVLTPVDLATAACDAEGEGKPLFVQISDTHIGFSKDANPDVAGTLRLAIERVNALRPSPALVLHTGDITHLSKAVEFDTAAELLKGLNVAEVHTVPGEHDLADATASEYFARFGRVSSNRGYYSFDHRGVHFVGLVNVLNFQAGGLGVLGHEQLAWLEANLKGCSSSTPIVVFAHMPLWTVYQPWGWGTADAEAALAILRRFGSVTIVNGHIHQIVQKVEGNITFHTARSTAYPQPPAGEGTGPGPRRVAPDQLLTVLGVTSARIARHPLSVSLRDSPLG